MSAYFENASKSERGVYSASVSTGLSEGSGVNAPLQLFSKHALKQTGFNPPREHRWARIALAAGASLLSLWLPVRAWALNPVQDVLQYNCRTWSRQNGLPVNGINAITQTQDGYLWLGTAAGLVRFDGDEFKRFDLAGARQLRKSVVTCLAGDRDGGLWVGLEHSSFGFHDGRSFSFRGKEAWGKLDMNVRSIMQTKEGTLWLAAERQVSRLTRSGDYQEVFGSSAEAAINMLNILCGFQDSRNRVWFGTDRKGVYYWQEGRISKLPDASLDSAIVFSLAEDKNGQIWVGTQKGLRCYDSTFQRKDIPPLKEEILALLVDRQGVLWIGTTGHGLARYRDGAYTFFSKTDGLADDHVRALSEDEEGSLWIGTRDGLSQLTDVKFPTQAAAEDASVKDALAVCASRKGGLWVGSSAGATYFDGKPRTYSTEAGLPNPYVKRVFEASNGDLYLVSGEKDLVVLSGNKVVATHSATNMVVGLAEDAKGVVVSVGDALYRAGTNSFAPYEFNHGEAPPLYWILNLCRGRDGAIWVASVNGICRVKDGAFRQWTVEQGLPDPRVDWICEDGDGVVWAATMTGIARLKDNQIRCISRDNGLFDNDIYEIVPDKLGNLWVDSGRGIFRVSRQSLNDFADGKTDRVECVPYDGVDSVKPCDKTVQEHSACVTADGRIWFPSSKGVIMIDPANVPANRAVPAVHIDRLRANGIEFDCKQRVVVQPGKGELEFHFTAPSFIAPQKMRFRCRLDGYDKDWAEIGDRRLALYTNLKPGRYTFRVLVANADGVWNTTGDSVKVQLLPHFYQSASFYLLCGVLAAGALAAGYDWRVRRLKRKQRALREAHDLLETKVRERTADLAEANASLKNEIEERKRMEREVDQVHRQLLDASRQAGMAEVATGVLHNVGNVLNSANVSATLVVNQLKRSKVSSLTRAVALMREHAADLGAFITSDPKGAQLPAYLGQVAEHLAGEQRSQLEELELLRKHIEHIKEIVAMQQGYAKVLGVSETVQVAELIEDALRMNTGALARHEVQLQREYDSHLPEISVDKHKVLQILVNLIRNAKYACDESGRKDKRLTVRVTNGGDRVRIAVMDNGVGIPLENLTRIFNHGFTTRKDGHGFGLHSGALAARELGGALRANSDGPGLGATFTLELPLERS